MIPENAIQVNGRWQPLEVDDLGALLSAMGYSADSRGVAVAVNGEVVPKAGWGARRLRSGDSVEIIAATQGG